MQYMILRGKEPEASLTGSTSPATRPMKELASEKNTKSRWQDGTKHPQKHKTMRAKPATNPLDC